MVLYKVSFMVTFFFLSSHVTVYRDGTEIELGQVSITHPWVQSDQQKSGSSLRRED